MKKVLRQKMRFLVLLPLAAFYLSGQASAETGNNSGEYAGQTLCDAGDDVENSCTTHTGKNLSVCGSRKKHPYIMYMVYGSYDNIIVSSPREGKFPLKHLYVDNEFFYFFKKNEVNYISYAVFNDSDPENELKGVGFMTINSYNNKIVDHDFCVGDVQYKSKDENDGMNRILDYGDREEKSPFHISHKQSVFSREAEKVMYGHLYSDR